MEFTKVEVGKRFPIEKVIKHFAGGQGGGSLDYDQEYKSLNVYIGLPRPTSREVNAFRRGLIRFALYPNEKLNTSVIMMMFDDELQVDLVYDINVLDSDMDGVVESNVLNLFMIDSIDGTCKGIRTMGLGEDFMCEINRITRNDGRYTNEEYNEWLHEDVYKIPLSELWKKSQRVDWDR